LFREKGQSREADHAPKWLSEQLRKDSDASSATPGSLIWGIQSCTSSYPHDFLVCFRLLVCQALYTLRRNKPTFSYGTIRKQKIRTGGN